MEGGVRLLAAGESVRSSDSGTSSFSRVNSGPVPCGTWSAVNLRRPVLHKIRFAAIGPRYPRVVGSEGPEGGPKALVGRIGNLETGLDEAVLKVFYAFRLHTG